MAHNMASKDKACTNGNISQCRWARQGRCMFRHEKQPAPNVEKVKECRNGDACTFKAQGRCYHYHSDVGVQKVKPPIANITPQPSSQSVPLRWQIRQQQHSIPSTQSVQTHSCHPAPSNEWQTVPTMWRPIQQQQFPHPPPPPMTPPPSGLPQAWCVHGKSCNLGRYCTLRHFSDEDFLQLQSQRRS